MTLLVVIVVAKCFLPTRTQQESAFQSNFITEMKSLHETETESSLNKLCQFLFLQLLFVCSVCDYKMQIFFHFTKTCTECNFVFSLAGAFLMIVWKWCNRWDLLTIALLGLITKNKLDLLKIAAWKSCRESSLRNPPKYAIVLCQNPIFVTL